MNLSPQAPAAGEARLESIFRAAPAGIGVTRNRIIVEFNERLSAITGYSREEITGRPARLLYPTEEEYELVGRDKYRQISERGAGAVETRWVRKDGAVIDVLLSSAPIDPADWDKGITFTVLDIIEQKRAARARDESERKYRALFELNADAAYVIDRATGRILDANPAAWRMYGYNREEFLSLSVQDISAEPAASSAWIAALNSPASVRSRLHRRKDGTVFPVEISANAVELEGRDVIIATGRDLSERLRKEQALRASEENYRTLIETVPGVVYVAEAFEPWRTLRVSRGLEALCGLAPEEFLERGSRWEDLIDERDRERSKAALRKAVAAGGVYAAEYRIRHVDGGLRWVYDHGRATRDKHGNPALLFGVSIDITAQKQAEEALRRSEYEKSLILNSTSEMFTHYDPDLRIVWVNRAAADSAGLPPEQLAGRKCYEIWHRRAAPCADCPVLRAKATGLPQQGEITTPDGRIWALRSYPIHNEAGEVAALIEFGQDITARKRSEEALRESEERFRMAAQVMGEVICGCDFTTGRTTWTGAIREVTGYGDAEFQRFGLDSCRELIHPEDREAASAALESAARAGSEYTTEFRLRRKHGAYVPVELRGVFLPRASGSPRMLASLKDVSERKRAEERLVQAQKMESVGRLAGGIAHDFNNLLTVINGYSSLLLSGMHELDPARPGVAEIEKAGQRAADLVRQLLAFSRKQVLRPCVLNVNDVVAQMEGMLRRLSGEDIGIELDLEPSLVPVRADPGQLHQVLLNLAANAHDAMPSGGRLNIRTRNVVLKAPLRDSRNAEVPAGRYCSFSVTDSGFGIGEEARAHLFEPFYTTKEVGKGTGFGLSTVHGIVTQSGGFITVESEVKKGTTFTVYLPAADDTAGEPSAPAAAETRDGTETILVVEDQREVADFVVATLESCGYRVFRAANAGEALELCRNTNAPLHLLLTDVVMPGMNGRELAARAEQLRPGIRVVYMSGYDEEALAQRLGPDPNAPLLFKPFTPSTLAETVAKQLRAVR